MRRIFFYHLVRRSLIHRNVVINVLLQLTYYSMLFSVCMNLSWRHRNPPENMRKEKLPLTEFTWSMAELPFRSMKLF